MPQRHVIRRQIVELTVADAATARRVTPLVSDLIGSRVTPLLERLFDTATGPDEMHRIDRLELDLGALDLNALAEQLPVRIEAALPAALARAGLTTAPVPDRAARPGAAPARPDAAADPLLLISQFARTGGVPWWSDSRRQRLIDEAVDQAASASPAALGKTFRGLIGDDAALRRLIPLLSNESLARVFAALAPGLNDLPHSLLARLALTPALGILAPARRRLIAWRALLRAALTDAGPALIETVLTEIATSLGITLALLLADLRATTGQGSEPDRLVATILALAERHPFLPETRAMEAPRTRLDRLVPSSDLAALMARLAPLAERLPDDGRAAWAIALTAITPDRSGPLTPAALAALLRPFLRAGLIALTDLADVLAPLARAEAEAAIPAEPPPAPVADEDSRIVATAGLCLLWPFLPRFFARLGLLDDRLAAFAAPAHQHRAVLLLHHLATGETTAPDFALVLAKVLCGLPPHAPHDVLEPVTDVEAAEARQLLDAVIAHAGCFGDISPDGLRGSFLMRDGILATRDGAWLLRVERRTPDAVLARLPWTTEWIRQPWMQAAMRVEW
jgi:hypothetical protein